MRVNALHRRFAKDVNLMYGAVSSVFPATMPQQYTTRQMNVESFRGRLADALAPHNISVPIHREDDEPENMLLLSGMWFHGGRIEVRLHVNTNTNRLNWTPKLWEQRHLCFWQFIMHELIHRHQSNEQPDRMPRIYRADADVTDLKMKEEHEYLGDCDEIEAYAHDAAVEFVAWYPEATFHQAIEKTVVRRALTIPTYKIYGDTFGYDKKNPAFAHFVRKTKSWFDLVHAERDFYRDMGLVA